MTGIFGILESSATQRYQDVTPTQELFFSLTSIVNGVFSGGLPAGFYQKIYLFEPPSKRETCKTG
jgi:hypothetical protein